tara:strand:+ start:3075 stop:3209 length:135 start_codon:yes stop_codon:yes gene_type:complete
MDAWWPTIASICIGVPIAYKCELTPLITGMLCAGINIMITLIVK